MNRHLFCPRIRRWAIFVLFLSGVGYQANAQFYSVKVDAIGLLTATFNAEGSMALSNHWTLHLPVKFNPWTFNDKKYKRLAVMPGARWWVHNSYSRSWFFGINAVASLYDHCGIIGNNSSYFGRDFRHKGYAYGAGASCGYSIPIKKRWNIEFEAGVAGVYADHDMYYNIYPTEKVGTQKGFLVVPGKIAANLVYLF